jgi:hypothetical protein
LDGKKERFVQKKGFWFEKAGDFQVRLKSFRQKITFCFAEKNSIFSSCKASDKEKHFSAHNDTDFALHQS